MPVGDLLDIFLFVLVSNLDVLPSRLELHGDLLTKPLIFNRESTVNDVRDIILHRPAQSPEEIGINTFHVRKNDPLPQYHFVESSNEKRIQEPPMEDGQAHHTPNELEVAQMLRVDARVRVDLQGVVIMRRVLKKTIEWVKHLVRKQEEELSGETAIIQAIFTIELDHQPLLQIVGALAHNFGVAILEDVRAPDLHMALAAQDPQSRLRTEVDKLPPKVTLVLRNILVERRRQSRVIPSGGLGVVVNEVDTCSVCKTHFPATR